MDRCEDRIRGLEPGARSKAQRARSRALGALVILVLILISALGMLGVEAIPTSSPLDTRAEFTTTQLSTAHPSAAVNNVRDQYG